MARDTRSRTRLFATLLLAAALSAGGGGSGSVGGAGVLFAAGADGGGAGDGVPSGGGDAAPKAPEATCRTNPDPLGLYALLGAEADWDEKELKRAFRRMAIKYYPDSKRSLADGGAMGRRVFEAWGVLSDADKRAHYDRTGTLPPPPAPPPAPDLWTQLFGGFNFRFDFGAGSGAGAGAAATPAAAEPAQADGATGDAEAVNAGGVGAAGGDGRATAACDPAGYYRVLGVACDATAQQIKRAYRKLSLQYLPEKHPPDAKDIDDSRAVAAAYAVLSDADERARYDRSGSDAQPSGANAAAANVAARNEL